MHDRDVEILRFFAAAQKSLMIEETPFGITEVSSLTTNGFLSVADKFVPGKEEGDSSNTVKAFRITRKGLNEIDEAKKQNRKDRRDFVTFVLAIVSTVLTAATLIVTILTLLQT